MPILKTSHILDYLCNHETLVWMYAVVSISSVLVLCMLYERVYRRKWLKIALYAIAVVLLLFSVLCFAGEIIIFIKCY